MVVVEEVEAQLLLEYGQAIDTSTLLAIISDFDLSNTEQLQSARQTLEILTASIETEEQSGFDASGASGTAYLNNERTDNGHGEDESASARSVPAWASQTDDTSLSQDLSSLDLYGGDSKHDTYDTRENSPELSSTRELDGLDQEGKENALIGIFPALKPFDIKWTLKKCKGDAGLAIDELMTQSFLEESGTRHRGIEAFSESDLPSGPRKRNGKKKNGRRLEDSNGSPTPDSPSQSKWDTGKQDIEFVSDRTGMPAHQVSSLYHKSGASLRATIFAIIEAHASLNIEADDPMIQINAHELHQELPSISLSDLETLLQVTHPSLPAARDLAMALSPQSTNGKSKIQIEFRHAPIEIGPVPGPKIRDHIVNRADQSIDISSAASAVNSLYQARETAYMQSQAAYRKGKSDHLMGGAAAYYSQVGRDLDSRVRSAEIAAADAIVASQSSRTELDLHGLSVKDAVRISRERVTGWWYELGEARVGGNGRVGAYKIVTGVGRHSEGGKGKLGPAVGKMLIREGWKVEVGSGVLIVTGVVRKK